MSMATNSTTDAQVLSQWAVCLQKARENELLIPIQGHRFRITRQNTGCSLGTFYSVNEVYQYLCGYENGWALGRATWPPGADKKTRKARKAKTDLD